MSQSPDPKDRRDVLERALRAVQDLQGKVDKLQNEKREPIAVIGMACRFPGHVTTPEQYWALLRDGVDAISEVPRSRWDIDAFYDPDPDAPGKMYTRMGGFVDDVDKFDSQFFGISPRETLKTDPQQRLAVEVGWEALENAAIPPHKLVGTQTGVFLGITNNDYSRLIERAGLENIDAYHLTGNFLNFAAGRIAYFFGFQGPTFAVDTACSSSGVSIHLACQSLRNRECNLALAGGVNLILSPEISITSTKARTLSPDGRCKTFDSRANGYVRSEGCGILVLKRLSEALADGDSIRAVIRGSAVNQDGASSGLTVPNKLAQAQVMRQALERAGLTPSQVDYVEAHGTGTPLGDPIEIRALASVYSEGRSSRHPLVVGTAKTNLGHAESAAGVAGVMKVVLSLQNRTIPPHLHFEKLNPAINLDEIPAMVPTRGMEWPTRDGRRRAGVSSFGGSGTIAHLILEEAPELVAAKENNFRSSQLFCLSARNDVALRQLAKRYTNLLASTTETLADICFSADAGRSHFNSRLSVVASTKEELKERLEIHPALDETAGASKSPSTDKPKVVFLFTGQGGQYVHMGKQLYESEPVFRDIINRCDELLRPHLPQSLLSVLYPAAGETPLDETRYTHVAMFAIQYALTALWRSWGIEPSIIMGHSVGEIVAATAAGQLSFEHGLQLMRERGRLMQALPKSGMMASLMASEQQVLAALEPYRDKVSIAALNGPESTVISGHKEAVQAILAKFDSQGVKVKALKVSNAFHSPLVDPVLNEFEQFAKGLQYSRTQIPLFSSMRLERVEDRPLDATYWRHNLRNTVRFSEATQKLYAEGYRVFLEIGPSPILVGMGSQCVPPGDSVWLTSLRQGRDDWQQILETLGALYESGADVNWDEFYRNRRARKVVLPNYPFQRESYWVESAFVDARVHTRQSKGINSGHPLLGVRLNSAVPLFENGISGSEGFLGEHRVHGKPVVPATALLEFASAAAEQVFATRQFSLKNTVFLRPLVLSEDRATSIQVSVTETAEGSANFKIFASDLEASGSKWTLHATGDLSVEEPAPAPTFQNLSEVRERCREQVDVATHYEALQARGLEFGPAFRGLESLHCGSGEVLAAVSVPVPIASGLQDYSFHPALLDACLQAVGPALPVSRNSSANSHTYLPQRLESFRVHAKPAGKLWSHVKVRKGADASLPELAVDVDVCEQDGRIVAEVRNLVLRLASRDETVATSQEDIDRCLFEMQWEPAPLQAQSAVISASGVRAPLDIAHSLTSWCHEKSSSQGLNEFKHLLPHLEALCASYFCQALRDIGFKFQQGRAFEIASEAHALGVLDKYHRLLGRIFEILMEDGYVTRDGSQWDIAKVPSAADPEKEVSSLLQKYPACRAEIEMVSRCGRSFAPAMRGECDVLQLLFPDGSVSDMEKLYEGSPFFAFYNELTAEAVASAIAGFSPDRPLRVLEIGAGTGSVTSRLLPKLTSRRTEYVFTDISGLFLAKAREKYSAYPFVDYRILDIEKDPLAQGFTANSFDLVIAANVLHATADLSRTLAHVQKLVSPDGLLLLMECTQSLRFADVIVGLTDGWWKFTDSNLRRSHALVSATKWQELLKRNGFVDVASSPQAETNDVLSKQSLIIARTPEKIATWLIFEDAAGTGAGVASVLQSRGNSCVLVSVGDQYLSREDGHFEIDPDRPEDFQQLLRQVTNENNSVLEGIVYLWPLNACNSVSKELASLKRSIQMSCGGALNLAKSLVSTGAPSAKGLWIVTRGSQIIDAQSALHSLAQSPASAVGSTISLEYPELRCVRLDLSPAISANEAEIIAQEILSGSEESVVAIRGSQRLVGRLGPIKAAPRELRKRSEKRDPYRVEISSPGILDNLSLRSFNRREPGRDEVEIEVHATGLGFRDVLMALGKYPEPSTVFGYECVGTIARVGAGVSQFQVGQRVIAVGPGTLASFVTISDERIVPVPESMSTDAAATIPSAFLTAQYALHDLGRISAGDRVLIHAAAGGVGLAAVQLAQNAKAEIFATAGSEEKRAYLRSLGITHVFDSRSLDFYERIMEITSGRGVDIVLNSLTGESISKSLALTARKGRFVEIGRNGIWNASEVQQFKNGVSYYTVDLAAVFDKQPGTLQHLFNDLMPKFSKGLLKPLPYRLFSADDSISAFRFMAQAKHIGKIVISHKPTSEALMRPNSSYLVTGGLSGLGLLVAEWVADRGATHLVLIGRTKPSADAAARIHGLEEKGVHVVVSQGDVSDRSHLGDLFSKFGDSLPELRGIIHSAGTLDDGVLSQQTWERFERVMAPKVDGAWHLHELSIGHPLDFFVLFSSAVSMLGSAGQANHVAACAFEDSLAHYRRGLGLPALCINWGPWSETGAATRGNVNERLSKKGFHPLEPVTGLSILERLLREQHVQVGAASINWNSYAASLPNQAHSKFFTRLLERTPGTPVQQQAKPVQKAALLEQLQNVPARNRRTVLETYVREQAIRVLGLKPSFKLDPNQGLASLGMDSLMTIELKNRLQTGVGKTLPSTIVFDHPTVTALTDYLETHVFGFTEPEPPKLAKVARAGAGDGSGELEQISDDEAEALLMKELADSENAT